MRIPVVSLKSHKFPRVLLPALFAYCNYPNILQNQKKYVFPLHRQYHPISPFCFINLFRVCNCVYNLYFIRPSWSVHSNSLSGRKNTCFLSLLKKNEISRAKNVDSKRFGFECYAGRQHPLPLSWDEGTLKPCSSLKCLKWGAVHKGPQG